MKRQDKAQSILYYPVAYVDTVDLRTVFRVTQQDIEPSPDQLAVVQWLEPTRSMMVGDVVETTSGTFRLESSDFKRI